MEGTASAKSPTQKEVTSPGGLLGQVSSRDQITEPQSQGEGAHSDSKIPELHRGILGRPGGQGARIRYIFFEDHWSYCVEVRERESAKVGD